MESNTTDGTNNTASNTPNGGEQASMTNQPSMNEQSTASSAVPVASNENMATGGALDEANADAPKLTNNSHSSKTRHSKSWLIWLSAVLAVVTVAVVVVVVMVMNNNNVARERNDCLLGIDETGVAELAKQVQESCDSMVCIDEYNSTIGSTLTNVSCNYAAQAIWIYQYFIDGAPTDVQASLLTSRAVRVMGYDTDGKYEDQVMADIIAADDILQTPDSAANVINIASSYGFEDTALEYNDIMIRRQAGMNDGQGVIMGEGI